MKKIQSRRTQNLILFLAMKATGNPMHLSTILCHTGKIYLLERSSLFCTRLEKSLIGHIRHQFFILARSFPICLACVLDHPGSAEESQRQDQARKLPDPRTSRQKSKRLQRRLNQTNENYTFNYALQSCITATLTLKL